jgi:cadmium resistance protein CadD (predicted permease)
MDLITWTLQATGLFIVTNIDDIIVLSLFYARGAGAPGTTARILGGQYLGFGAILAAAVLVALGARSFLPEEVIPYFGLIPLVLGLLAAWRAWRAWRDDDDDDDDEGKVRGKPLSVATIAAVTFANGGDNIGVYVPVFATVGTAGIIAYSIVFLALVAVLVGAARFVATRRPIAEVLERWEQVLFPIVLIGLGIVILVEGGAFGL